MRCAVSVVTGCSHLSYAFSFTISVIIIFWVAILIRILATCQKVLLNHIACARGHTFFAWWNSSAEALGFRGLEKARTAFLRSLSYLTSFTFMTYYMYCFILFKVWWYLLDFDHSKKIGFYMQTNLNRNTWFKLLVTAATYLLVYRILQDTCCVGLLG